MRDITADIGPLFQPATERPIPMYSFDRAAYALWQAVFEGLVQSGRSEQQAIDWLQSKHPRWALDGELGKKLHDLGVEFGRKQ